MNRNGEGGSDGLLGQGVVVVHIRQHGKPHPENTLVFPGQRVKFVTQGGPNTFVAKFNNRTPFKNGKREFKNGDEEEVLSFGPGDTPFKYDVDPGDGGDVIDPIITVRGGSTRSLTVEELQMISAEVEELSQSLSRFQDSINSVLEAPDGQVALPVYPQRSGLDAG